MMVRCLVSCVMLGFLSTTVGAATAWQVDPKASTLTFTATQNNAPVTGQFQRFAGAIQFDPADLKSSQVEINVDLASVKTGDSQIADTLQAADWFNASVFPKAVFKTSSFVKTGDKTYQANGTLTLRDKTVPVILNFTLEKYAEHSALVQGSTVIKRNEFGVGQGEWSKSDAIKDDVKIEFSVSATR